jgi:hypothetical protein
VPGPAEEIEHFFKDVSSLKPRARVEVYGWPEARMPDGSYMNAGSADRLERKSDEY